MKLQRVPNKIFVGTLYKSLLLPVGPRSVRYSNAFGLLFDVFDRDRKYFIISKSTAFLKEKNQIRFDLPYLSKVYLYPAPHDHSFYFEESLDKDQPQHSAFQSSSPLSVIDFFQRKPIQGNVDMTLLIS